tara:strand:+ start:68 stop:532 length:465 start_codon:yes stop_codon:yes gene_type:complete
MRQWYKHVVGCETTSCSSTKDHAWNEISGRYVPVKDYYYPSDFRKQSEKNKQGSDGFIAGDIPIAVKTWDMAIKNAEKSYQELLRLGVAKEQARCILPLSQYTEVYWTASLQAIINFIKLRDEETSQWEIRQYAIAMKEMMSSIFPEAMAVLCD